MSISIRTYGSIHDAGADRWDDLARACGAPVFYRSTFLAAFERFPLHDVQSRFYITGQDDAGRLVFALPAYLLHRVDPMSVLHDHFPSHADTPVLVNHVWHCYDTQVLACRLDAEVVRTMLDAFERLARQLDVGLWGFTNVDGTGELSRALEEAGMAGVDVEQRFVADLSAIRDLDHYLATLKERVRQNLRRYTHIAARAGVVTIVAPVEEADLDGFMALARAGAAKYNNADYYRPGIFQGFLRALGAHARVIEQRLDGKLMGSMVLLVDDANLHCWVAGNDYEALPQLSPFYLGILAAINEALLTGRPFVEAGRRNARFKTRHGMRARPVRAHFAPVPRSDADRSR